MGLFGSKQIKITDADFGEIESFSVRPHAVSWRVERKILNNNVEILLDGDAQGISEIQKQIILSALGNEAVLKTESEKALKEQYENAEMPFTSIETHFELKAVMVQDEGFGLAFQEKEGRKYFFNVQFEDNKHVGVSIEG